MTRTVKVELEADVAGYIGGVAEADKATDKLDDQLKDLDRDLDKVTRDSAETAAGLAALGGTAKEVGNDVDDLGKSTEQLGEKTKVTSDDTGKMTSRIAELKDGLQKLASEFDRTGDPELLKKFRADSSELKGLENMVKLTEKLGDDIADVGVKAEKNQGIFGSLKAGAEGGLTSPIGLGLGGVAAGPGLAGLGGLALGGIGIAGAGAGVASAVLGNPQAFQVEWQKATAVVQKDFLDAGAAFTGPTLLAIRSIGPTIDSWHLADALAPAAKYVPMIVDGLEGAATGFEHGFADAIAKAGPDVQVLSTGLTQLGIAGGDALSHIADGAEGGAQALHDVIEGVTLLVEGFGYATEAAEKFYDFLQEHPVAAAIGTGGLSIGASIWANALGNVDTSGQHLGKTLEGVALSGDLAADAAKSQSSDLQVLSQQMNATTITSDSLAESMSSKLLNSMMSLDQAALSFDTALTRVHDSVKQNGHDLSENTEHGVANRAMILGLVQANIQQYQANVNAKMGADDAAKAYDAGTASIEKQLHAAGFTTKAIDGMIQKYKQVPDQVNTDIVLHGLEDAIRDLNTTLKLINGIHDTSAIINVTTVYHTKGSPNVGEGGTKVLKGAYAEGTDSAAQGLALVGEHGPEILDMRGGERVYTAAQTRSMMSPTRWSGGGSGGGAIAVSVGAAAGGDLTPLGSLINKMLRDGLIVVKASQVRAS